MKFYGSSLEGSDISFVRYYNSSIVGSFDLWFLCRLEATVVVVAAAVTAAFSTHSTILYIKPDIIASKTSTLQPLHKISVTNLLVADAVLVHNLSFVGAEDLFVNFQMNHHQTVAFVPAYYLDMIPLIIFHDSIGEFPRKVFPRLLDYFE